MKFRIPATSANVGSGFDALGIALSMYNEVDILFFRILERAGNARRGVQLFAMFCKNLDIFLKMFWIFTNAF